MNPEDKKKIRELHKKDKAGNLNQIKSIGQKNVQNNVQNKHSKGDSKETLFEKTKNAKTQSKNKHVSSKIGRSEKNHER
ncbi:hypothetical protein ACFFIF_10095 [Vagococcus entomophilus]|uniref:Uncharacterized protein n=1 Tax=Vagococcus entomophilus TaxID=1160095 RepID=A0A430AGC4_9ENTE|nr:hypothetical protein [Vagococcus entomophilus]RSU06904.1 hypothetical protein CBF30_06490 [Vagococcus entomophilus]